MRFFLRVFAVSVALAGIAVIGSTIASSSIVNRADQIPNSGVFLPESPISAAPAAIAIPDAPTFTKIDFDQTFADVAAMPRRGNTPANRERLRDAGWKLISASR